MHGTLHLRKRCLQVPHGRAAAEDDGGGLQGAQQLRRDGALRMITAVSCFSAPSDGRRNDSASKLQCSKMIRACSVQPDCAAYTSLPVTMPMILKRRESTGIHDVSHSGARKWSSYSVGIVCEQVVRRLEAQTYTEVAKLETNTMLRSLNAFQQAIMLVDVAARGWEILHANNALLQRLGACLEMPASALLLCVWWPIRVACSIRSSADDSDAEPRFASSEMMPSLTTRRLRRKKG